MQKKEWRLSSIKRGAEKRSDCRAAVVARQNHRSQLISANGNIRDKGAKLLH